MLLFSKTEYNLSNSEKKITMKKKVGKNFQNCSKAGYTKPSLRDSSVGTRHSSIDSFSPRLAAVGRGPG